LASEASSEIYTNAERLAKRTSHALYAHAA